MILTTTEATITHILRIVVKSNCLNPKKATGMKLMPVVQLDI